jgi:quercetin dioxygenase-like cupin family protein
VRSEETMKKIFYVICLTLLLSVNVWARDVNTVKVDVLAKTSSSWDGSALPDYSSGKPEITILRIEIPPGVQLRLHKHPVINAGVLLKGELTVETEDNKVLNLKAGDSIVEVVNKWHYGKNEGRKPAELIMFYAGTAGVPITIKK